MDVFLPCRTKKAGHHLCVFSCASAARRCVWTSSHRTSSCRRKVALPNASAGVLAGATFSHTPSHSRQYGRCAASSSPCWTLWQTQKEVCFCVCLRTAESAGLVFLPPARLFAVGTSTRYSAQPLALLTELILFLSQPAGEVRQVIGVQGWICAQPVSRVRLFLYPNIWKGCMKDVSEQPLQQLMFHLIDWKYF